MGNCIYCDKKINNIGSLASHEKRCKENPNNVTYDRTSLGFKSGNIPWNKDRNYDEECLENTIQLIESGEVFQRHENVIRKHIKRYLIHLHGNTCCICNTID